MRAAVVAFILLSATNLAFACGCAKPLTAADAAVRRNADVIFTGDVVDVAARRVDDIVVVAVRFRVVHMDKGASAEFISIEVHNGGTSCDQQRADFVVGQRYLMSGFTVESNGAAEEGPRYYSNYCSLRERVRVTPDKSLERTRGR
jgi:hypothetical protein